MAKKRQIKTVLGVGIGKQDLRTDSFAHLLLVLIWISSLADPEMQIQMQVDYLGGESMKHP